jgi:hypothetical protein
MGFKPRTGLRRHTTKRSNQKGQFFSLSLRERAGVREDQIVSLLGSPLTLTLSLRERERAIHLLFGAIP